MMLPILTTLLAIVGVLLLLVNVAATSGYTGRVPGGADAMGVVVLLFAAIGGGIALLIATWCCAGAGGLAWIHPRTGIATTIASLVTLGIALASAGLVIAWMERMGAWVVPVGWVAGGLAPVALGVLLIVCAWASADQLRDATILRLVTIPLALIGLAGIGAGLFGLGVGMHQSAQNSKRRFQEAQADESRWEAKRNRPPLQAMQEDFAEMSPDTPLWCFIAGLPDTSDAQCRTFAIDRALQVPNFDWDLERTLTGNHPRYRHGCLDLIRFARPEQLKPEWSAFVIRAASTTAQQIRTQENWLTPESFSNPDPAEHIRALVYASRRFAPTDESRAVLEALRESIDARPPSPQRDAALNALNEALRQD